MESRNHYEKMTHEQLRRAARCLVCCLKDGPCRREYMQDAAELIEHFLGKCEYLNVTQWIGGYIVQAARIRKRGGIRNWLRAFRLCREGIAQSKRIYFGDEAKGASK